MFFFGKNKAKEEPPAAVLKPSAPASAPKPAVSAPVSADDFFGDLDRKKKKKKEVKLDIDVPEVTGLRERPADAPEQIFNNVATETLSVASLHEEGYVVGDMKNFRDIAADSFAVEELRDKSHDNDIPFDPDAPEETKAPEVFDPSDPDAFFRSIDRKKPKRQKFAIDLPEVTGLRETPLVAEGDTVAEIDLSMINTDVLRAEPPSNVGPGFGDIDEISVPAFSEI